MIIPDHGAVKYLRIASDDGAENLHEKDSNTSSVSKLQYIVLASDGVWDVLSIEEVKDIIQDCKRAHGATLRDALNPTSISTSSAASSAQLTASGDVIVGTSAHTRTASVTPLEGSYCHQE